MKNKTATFFCAALLALAAVTPFARAELIAYEGFDYPADADLSGQTGGTGFSTAWTATTGDTARAGSLQYTDALGNRLLTSGGHAFYTGVGGTSQPTRDLPAVQGADGTTTYVSFIGQRVGDPSTTFHRAANVSLFNSTLAASQEQVAIGEATGRTEDAWALIPDGSAANTRASSSPIGDLSFIVVRIDHLAGGDNAYLFVNPDLNAAPDIATADAESLGVFDFSFNRLRPFAGNPAGGFPHAELLVDELRVGTTFADVAPLVPEPSCLALLGVGMLGLLRRR